MCQALPRSQHLRCPASRNLRAAGDFRVPTYVILWEDRVGGGGRSPPRVTTLERGAILSHLGEVCMQARGHSQGSTDPHPGAQPRGGTVSS